MKKIRRRVLGVAVGLTLGWLAQGYAAGLFLPAAAIAQETANSEPLIVEGERMDAPYAGAEQLLPNGQDMRGFGMLATWALCLFGVAVIVGVPASSFADRSRHDPADQLHDGHDASPVVHVHKGSH